MPDTSIDPGKTETATDTSTGAGSGSDFRKELEAERNARIAAEKRYEEHRRMASRQAAELGELRRKVQPNFNEDDYQEPNDFEERPRRSNGRFKRNEKAEYQAYQSALDGFQLDLMRMSTKLPGGKWEPYYDRVVEFAKDPLNADSIAIFDPDGNLDYRRTLRAAAREIQLQDMYAEQAKSAAKRTELNDNQDRDKRLATVSGGGATHLDDAVNLDDMSADDMVKAGLVAIDPTNPPSFARSMYRKR